MSISTTDGRDISSSSIIGPFHEGYELRLTCESGGGKPIPRVTWYNGSNVISGKFKKINQNMQNWNDIAIWRNFPQIWQDIFHLNHLSMFHEIYPYNGNPSISRKIQILIWRQNHQNKTRQSNVQLFYYGAKIINTELVKVMYDTFMSNLVKIHA